MKKSDKKLKISGKLIFNLAVILICAYMIIYFFASEDGLIDLLSTPGSFSLGWLIVAFLVFNLNPLIDSVVTLIFIRSKYKSFSFFEAIKVAYVGVFFSAITPSSTGGQPMQLYLMAKRNINVGFGSACMTQKFIVYQIVTTAFSFFAVFARFDLFKTAFSSVWATLFVILGFTVQILVTAMFLIVSFSQKLTGKILSLIEKICRKIKFIKNPDKLMDRLNHEVEMFHMGNRKLFNDKKLLVVTYLLVFLQVMCILSVPYFIYISFGLPQTAIAGGQNPATFFDFICIQSFVLFTSNLVPLPGASGGAELAFTMYFSPFFIIGGVNKIKPAILLWRMIVYYGAIAISAPFSYFTKGRNNELHEEENHL